MQDAISKQDPHTPQPHRVSPFELIAKASVGEYQLRDVTTIQQVVKAGIVRFEATPTQLMICSGHAVIMSRLHRYGHMIQRAAEIVCQNLETKGKHGAARTMAAFTHDWFWMIYRSGPLAPPAPNWPLLRQAQGLFHASDNYKPFTLDQIEIGVDAWAARTERCRLIMKFAREHSVGFNNLVETMSLRDVRADYHLDLLMSMCVFGGLVEGARLGIQNGGNTYTSSVVNLRILLNHACAACGEPDLEHWTPPYDLDMQDPDFQDWVIRSIAARSVSPSDIDETVSSMALGHIPTHPQSEAFPCQ